MRRLHGIASIALAAALVGGGACGGVKNNLLKSSNEGDFYPVNVLCNVGHGEVKVHVQDAGSNPVRVTYVAVSGGLSKHVDVPLKPLPSGKFSLGRVIVLPSGRHPTPASCSVTDVKWRNTK